MYYYKCNYIHNIIITYYYHKNVKRLYKFFFCYKKLGNILDSCLHTFYLVLFYRCIRDAKT